MIQSGLTISPLGDTAIILNFGNKINKFFYGEEKVLQLFHKLKTLSLPFVKDIVPAYSSLAIFYDLLIMKNKNPVNKTSLEIFTEQIKNIIEEDMEVSSLPSRKIKIPVCYAEKYALDIHVISKEKKLPVNEIICLHTAKKYKG